MDVNELKRRQAAVNPQKIDSPESMQKSLKSLSSSIVNVMRSDSVSVEMGPKSSKSSVDINKVRQKTNEVISVVNFASEATSEIEKLVSSVSGIVEQADKKDISDDRLAKLEQEAGELVQEIKRVATSSGPDGVRPLAGEKIALEVEEELGKALEVILPDDAQEAFGLGTLRLSPKESILQTRTTIKEARARLEQLKDALKESEQLVGGAVARLEVAQQNSEAAESSVRDLDNALHLTHSLRNAIEADPELALKSAGKLQGEELFQ